MHNTIYTIELISSYSLGMKREVNKQTSKNDEPFFKKTTLKGTEPQDQAPFKDLLIPSLWHCDTLCPTRSQTLRKNIYNE